MQTANRKAVIYCRVSTKEQVDEGGSLQTQEKICRDYALKNGYEIAAVFIEQGESAKTAERTELQKLLNYCSYKKNVISAVISYKLDRISRNTDDYSQIRLLLKRYGVEIKSTSEYFENTPAGRFMENIIANVAQFDNDVRTERSIGGMKDAAREGRYVWSAPLGYSNSKVARKSNITPNELAPLIRRAFEMVSTGLHSIDEIHQNITSAGLLTRSNKQTSKSHFHRILRNETYAGWIHKFGEQHKGIFEPIISEELFNSVQHILKKKKRILGEYKLEHPDFPLRRFVKDDNGNKLTGAWSKGRYKKYPYYRFNKTSLSFTKALLEDKFSDFLNSFSLEKQHFSQFKKSLKENLINKLEDKQTRASRIKSTVNSLKEKQNQLIEKNLKGFVSNEILKQQLDTIEKETLDLTLELSQCAVRTHDFNQLIKLAAKFIFCPGDIWRSATFSQKIQLQWFNFPLGVTFNGKNFGTSKVCSLFKLKEEILAQMSYRVPSKEFSLNNPEIPNDQLWDEIGRDFTRLEEIFHPPEVKEDKCPLLLLK